jgi:ATP-binding cassette subfamily B protein
MSTPAGMDEQLLWGAAELPMGIAMLLGKSTSVTDWQSALGGEETLARGISVAADRAAVQAVALTSEYEHLAECLRDAAPLAVSLGDSEQALLLLKVGRRHATVLGRDGRTHRMPLQEITDRLQVPVPEQTQAAIDALVDELDTSLLETLRTAHMQGRPLFVGWKLGSRSPRAVHGQTLARRAAALVLAHVAQVGFWITSWIVLVSALSGLGDRDALLLLWGAALATAMILLPLETFLEQDFAVRLGVMIKQVLLKRALAMDKGAVRQLGIGALLAQSLEANTFDQLATRGAIRVLLTLFDMQIILILFYLLAGFHLLWLLFVGMLLFVAALCWRYYGAERRLHRTHLAVTALHAEEMIGHRARKVFVGRDQWHAQEDARLADYEQASAAVDRIGLTMGTVHRFWAALGVIVVLADLYTGGELAVALIGFVIFGFGVLAGATTGMAQLLKALVSYRYLSGFESEPVDDSELNEVDLRADGAELQAKGLTYHYPGTQRQVLNNANLRIESGQKVMLSGPSGSGKSTLGALLAGRLQPDSGLVISHGLDRHIAGAKGWLRHVCYVPQAGSNHVLTETFAFNLLLGRAWPPSPEDMAEAYRVALALGLGSLIEKMPAGMMQMVGEGGWRLSQGERSRLFVARGILQGAHMLIADELLSPLDPETSLDVLHAIEQLPGQVMLIAHS